MNKQFTTYAQIYDELFSSTQDYKKEVDRYSKILKKHRCKNVLEVGCGTGNRGKFFAEKGFAYTGLDISRQMLGIARKKHPGLTFIQGDARSLKLRKSFDAILFLGKGSAYLKTNSHVLLALKSMKNTVKEGIIIIDAFDAGFILPNFKKNIAWSKKIANKTIIRKSTNELDLRTGWTWKRKLTYLVKEKTVKKYSDTAILRAFSKSEMKIFFALAGIKLLKSYTKGDTLVTIGKV